MHTDNIAARILAKVDSRPFSHTAVGNLKGIFRPYQDGRPGSLDCYQRPGAPDLLCRRPRLVLCADLERGIVRMSVIHPLC